MQEVLQADEVTHRRLDMRVGRCLLVTTGAPLSEWTIEMFNSLRNLFLIRERNLASFYKQQKNIQHFTG